MHACGHDVHTASLLGVAKMLNILRHQFNGTVRLLFQPGEEVLPGGAKKILETGLLNNPKPDYILAQHVYPSFRLEKLDSEVEHTWLPQMKSTWNSRSGRPWRDAHTLIDPVLIASHVVIALQQVISRRLPADIPAVLSFGKFDAPGATNVIPPIVRLEGTFRIVDETWRKIAHQEIEKTVVGLTTAMGGTASCRIVSGYPALYNDPDLTRIVHTAATQYLGAEKIRDLPARMTAEDFAYYAQISPVFYRLGTVVNHQNTLSIILSLM